MRRSSSNSRQRRWQRKGLARGRPRCVSWDTAACCPFPICKAWAKYLRKKEREKERKKESHTCVFVCSRRHRTHSRTQSHAAHKTTLNAEVCGSSLLFSPLLFDARRRCYFLNNLLRHCINLLKPLLFDALSALLLAPSIASRMHVDLTKNGRDTRVQGRGRRKGGRRE